MKTTFLNKIIIKILILGIFLSCNKTKEVSFFLEKEKILKIHNLQRDYHFKKDSVAFVNQLSDNFISVNKGKITSPKREETVRRYHQYFSSVEFVKWDDAATSVSEIYQDGKKLYTDYMIWRKNGENWQIMGKTFAFHQKRMMRR